MIKLLIVILPFLLSSVGVSCLQRKLTYKTDPGCGDKCKDVAGTLIHVTAAGPNDTIHHVWDFFHKPTVFLALTPVNTTLTVDWDRFLQKEAHSWKLSHKHQYAFAYVIDKVIEYNDVNDIAYYQPSAEKRVLSADAFHWTLEDVVDSSDSIVVELKGVYAHGNESEQSGHIRVKLSAFGTQQYSNSTPHLYHTANATGMDIVFDNLPVSFNHSRYALELGIFNTNEDHGITPIKTKELDDEHTPGVFTVAELLTTHKEQFSGFLQWKTVSYKSPERLMTSSTDVNDSIPTTINHPEKSFHDSGVYSYFGQELDKISANSIYVSFGEPLDNYYNGTRYLTWTFLAGIGQPVEESFSLMVVLILILGLAAAGTLVIITGGCIISRLVSRTRDQLLS